MNYDNLHTQIIIRRIITQSNTQLNAIANCPKQHKATIREIQKNNIKRLKNKSKTK